MSENFFNAIEALSRRRAEVSAEIAKQNDVVCELNRAIEVLKKAQLESEAVILPSVCSICSGTGCSTCEPHPSCISGVHVPVPKGDSLVCQECGVVVHRPLPPLVRCIQCGDTSAFMQAGRCSKCWTAATP